MTTDFQNELPHHFVTMTWKTVCFGMHRYTHQIVTSYIVYKS